MCIRDSSSIGSNVRLESTGLFRIGSLFFVLQVGTMVGWGADALIISSTLGPAQVAIYSVGQRLFQFVTQPLAIVNMPLWGAYADAHAKGDTAFIRQTFRTSMMVTFVGATLGALALFLGSEWLLRYWTQGRVVVAPQLVALLALWTCLLYTSRCV